MRTLGTATLCTLLALSLGGCGQPQPTAGRAADMPRFEGAGLSLGRSVWMANCRNCHLLGVAGAPAVTDHSAWVTRIAMGREALYTITLNGIPDAAGGWLKVPRGGNPRLAEQEVRRAVDYMLVAVEALAQSAPQVGNE